MGPTGPRGREPTTKNWHKNLGREQRGRAAVAHLSRRPCVSSSTLDTSWRCLGLTIWSLSLQAALALGVRGAVEGSLTITVSGDM